MLGVVGVVLGETGSVWMLGVVATSDVAER